MKRRLLSSFLVFILAIGLLPSTVFAEQNPVLKSTLTLNKTTFAPGEDITVTLITDKTFTRAEYAEPFELTIKGLDSFVKSIYPYNDGVNNVCTFEAPDKKGTYELELHFRWYDDFLFGTSIKFTVSENSGTQPDNVTTTIFNQQPQVNNQTSGGDWRSAISLTEGRAETFTLPAPNVVEWYKFTTTADNATVIINLDRVEGGQFESPVNLRIIDGKDLQSGKTTVLKLEYASKSTEIYYQLSTAGTYYISINPFNISNGKHLSPLQIKYQIHGSNINESIPTTPPSKGNAPSGFQGESISVGAKFSWSPMSGGVGYRIYRSENANDEGISITDFYITCNEFVDVNVKPNRTYYYTIRQVKAEAKPFDSIPEQLSLPSEKIKINTGSTILGDELTPPTPNAVKKFILMTLDNPYMTINGEQQEIDSGRGTTPILLNNRTMVPIRAIVEGMGGSVNWNDANREISLNYQQNTVKMTLDQGEFYVNGAIKTADVPSTSINSRTMVPIRFAAESLGCAIDWLNSTRQVVIVYY